jgi:glycine hydroxymethyltransferase
VQSSEEYHKNIFGALEEADFEVYRLITKEYERRQNTLQLIAAENQCSKAVLAALGSVLQNKTAEGFSKARLHGGCCVVDEIEDLAVARAKQAFGARYANVQPHSGTTANQIVLTALLESGDKILSLALNHGGHFSHGSKVSFTGKFFNVEHYCVDRETFLLDYETIREQAIKFKPRLIICGTSVYSRTVDFKKFREIADEVGAYLLADISHISGLVIAGAHPSPVDYAHFTTTSTYKSGGPRGGLILMGKDYDLDSRFSILDSRRVSSNQYRESRLWEHIQKATFPGVQGTPYLNNIAAKAVFLKETLSDEYKARQFKIIENAKSLAKSLLDLGHDVVTGGTDNHMILVNVAALRKGLTGVVAQRCLEQCGIVVDKISLPYEEKGFEIGSGIRAGTPVVTRNGMGTTEMESISALVDTLLRKIEIISDSEYKIDESFCSEIADKVKQLCCSFPLR